MPIVERLSDLQRVVITGVAGQTALGNAEQTFLALLSGESGLREVPYARNFRTKVAGPLYPEVYQDTSENQQEWFSKARAFTSTDAYQYIPDRKQVDRIPLAVALADKTVREAARQAGLVDTNDQLLPGINRRRFSVWVGSGIASACEIIEVNRALYSVKDDDSKYDLERGSRKIEGASGLRIFPQDVAGYPAITLGAQGWSGSIFAACATGGSNIGELFRLIQSGYALAGVAGGVETAVDTHISEAIGTFAKDRITSANPDPKKASRPFDVKRDGFVPASGVGIVVMERLDHARDRGITPLAEVVGAWNSVDGYHRTSLDPGNVAATMTTALPKNRSGENILRPDVIMAHATSTPAGDVGEAEAISLALGEKHKYPYICAIKGNLGHLLGGAGAINVIMAVMALQKGILPRLVNLDEVDPSVRQFGNFRFVMENVKLTPGMILCNAFGFGGFNACMSIIPYEP